LDGVTRGGPSSCATAYTVDSVVQTLVSTMCPLTWQLMIMSVFVVDVINRRVTYFCCHRR